MTTITSGIPTRVDEMVELVGRLDKLASEIKADFAQIETAVGEAPDVEVDDGIPKYLAQAVTRFQAQVRTATGLELDVEIKCFDAHTSWRLTPQAVASGYVRREWEKEKTGGAIWWRGPKGEEVCFFDSEMCHTD